MNFRNILIGNFSWRRLTRSLLLIPVAVYIGLFIIGAFFSNYVLFHPPKNSYKIDDTIIRLPTSGGEMISARFYEPPNAKYTILFSNGNGEDIGTIALFAENLSDAGFNVFTYDYRGYGTSDGTPSEDNTYEDAEAAYQYLISVRGIAPTNIILHGRSLGGGPTSDLASKHKTAGVILESTFTSAFAVPFNMRILPFDKYPNIEKVKSFSSPVLVIHGKKDRTISFVHGERLFEAVSGEKYSLWIDNAGHNNLFYTARAQYLKAIRDFANKL